MTHELVQLTVVPNELEAEMVRSLLSTAGIVAMLRETDLAAAGWDGVPSRFGPREVLVHAADFQAARQLLDARS